MSLFDVKKQLTFYGAYHSNSVNVVIHIIFVPIILWTFQVMATRIPLPEVVPKIHHVYNDYLVFDLNVSSIHASLYLLYYLTLEPLAAVLYAPQLAFSVLTATAFAQHTNGVKQAALLHSVAWIAQFLGHGLAEKRAPALLDNLVGAVVLAPFFVHLELLFGVGYRPKLHKQIQNSIGMEIARIRKAEGDKVRASKEL